LEIHEQDSSESSDAEEQALSAQDHSESEHSEYDDHYNSDSDNLAPENPASLSLKKTQSASTNARQERRVMGEDTIFCCYDW
jgi:hypothetical protein